MLGLSRSAILRLVEMGFVKPQRGPRRAYLFSFQDVVLLRTAHALRSASIPTARILRALRRLKDELPADAPLSGLRIADVGAEPGASPPAVIRQLAAARRPPAPAGAARAAELFRQAEALESVDLAAAERAYGQAIAVAPDFTNAYLNLGALLCEGGQCAAAVRLFTQGIARRPDEPLLYFNRAVALEDLHRFGEALESYDLALQLDPDLADAHFNAGRLHDKLGHPQRAIRHYSAYRRLSR